MAWVQPNSQLGLGFVLQNGNGEAQKTTDVTIQDVEAKALTLGFSATHSF